MIFLYSPWYQTAQQIMRKKKFFEGHPVYPTFQDSNTVDHI